MNKNKLIFAIVGAILLFLILLAAFNLNKKSSVKNTKVLSGNFNIWIVGDDKQDFNNFISDFKLIYKKYQNKVINVESFNSFEDYSIALSSAIISGKAPDLFVLNNMEKHSIFDEQTQAIDPELINPNDFRKKYKGVFGDDLISSIKDGEENKEFLIGLPVGYETLGIYHKRSSYIKKTDLETISGLVNLIKNLKEKQSNVIPIALGNGSTVPYSNDILIQMFMLESNVTKLSDITGNILKSGLASYLLYGDIEGTNAYNSKLYEMSLSGENALDLFSRGDVSMVVGYPRMLLDIANKGYRKNFLLAEPFPHHFSQNGSSLLNYNYFVINKDTKENELANDILSYLSSDSGVEKYLSYFKYYLPALLSLESDKLEEKINENYNVTLGDFYNPDFELSSFDKGTKILYDKEVINILDNPSNYIKDFEDFKDRIICKTNKFITLTNLSNNCE